MGFIGTNLCRQLMEAGNYECYIFDYHKVKILDKSLIGRVPMFFGDFSNSGDLKHVLDQVKIDVVVHLVSTTFPSNSNQNIGYDLQTNIASTIQLLDAMHERNVNEIVFISSGSTVFGPPVFHPMNESHPTNPLCSYGITKLAIAKYIQLYAHLYGLHYLILRPSNPFGPFHLSQKIGFVDILLKKLCVVNQL
ncbi:MAG: NAD-dependent epimerase/dehydratase family protein [Fibrobacteria bacterium]|nr:NAD-dependent epimerase/dehydratase family protein [Fibrobacteria bacterium]